MSKKYVYVTDWYGNPGTITTKEEEIEQILDSLETVFGYRPKLTEREDKLWIRYYRNSDGRCIVEGMNEFDYNHWLRDPQWELVFELAENQG